MVTSPSSEVPLPPPLDEAVLQDLLGYLNFSSGKPDSRFHQQLNRLSAWLRPTAEGVPLVARLNQKLDQLATSSPAFSDCHQARAVIRLVFDAVLPAYRQHHADLLFHLQEADFLQPFFLARVFESVLSQRGPWEETARIVAGSLAQLNDYLGHRPIAVLENRRRHQPYPHERHRPVPLFIRGSGVASGPYAALLEGALEILAQTPSDLLAAAHFQLENLDELAVDMRAYDHSHPVFKRTNYTFGEWDPYQIDLRGNYRRFIVRTIILESLLSWMEATQDLGEAEKLLEASAVLAGTILMASAVSGSGPDTHNSAVSLTHLLPRIARQRDAFYSRLLQTLTGPHAQRLKKEAEENPQPFGRIRQHLNLRLAHYGCRQMQRSTLAQMYARMGYPDAARRQAAIIPAASTRFETELQWRITSIRLLTGRGQLREAARYLVEIDEYLHRGIECGALVDPWNILGFQGHFPLFQAREDSVADPRVDRLLELMEDTFGAFSRLLCEAAATGDRSLCDEVSLQFQKLAEFWEQFATTVVSDLLAVDSREAFESAQQVSQALLAWNSAGEAAGDVAFWKQHVGQFQSAKAYAIVVEVLLRRGDTLASMNLLIQWLSENESVELEHGPYSFMALLSHWMSLVLPPRVALDGSLLTPRQLPAGPKSGAASVSTGSAESDAGPSRLAGEATRRSGSATNWSLIRRMFAALEINGGIYWSVPMLSGGVLKFPENASHDWFQAPPDDALQWKVEEPEETLSDEDEALFGAAYENVVYRDSAQDGNTGDTVDEGVPDHDSPLEEAGRQLDLRLKFLVTVSQLWREAATSWVSSQAPSSQAPSSQAPSSQAPSSQAPSSLAPDQPAGPSSSAAAESTGPNAPAASEMSREQFEALVHWRDSNLKLQRQVNELVESISLHQPIEPSGDPESMLEYDRELHTKFSLLNSVISAQVVLEENTKLLSACLPESAARLPPNASKLDRTLLALHQAVLKRDMRSVQKLSVDLNGDLRGRPLLYVPLDKGGRPKDVLAARNLQQVLRFWLIRLPRLGLFRETWQLLSTAFYMERKTTPVGMSITEFDRLLQSALHASLESLVTCGRRWQSPPLSQEELAEKIGVLTEGYLTLWNKHSSTMRLSSVEALRDLATWRRVRSFIRDYGAELFQTRILTLGNLRAIVHRGADWYLDYLAETEDPLHPSKLLADLDHKLARSEAETLLELVFRCLVEKFDRFMEYNSTTTQSDYGEQLHCLLDFLRTETQYERQAWNLYPLILAHEVLARGGNAQAAEIWSDVLRSKTAPIARQFLSRLRKLEKQHSIRLPSITDRLSERFVKPLALDRILAQVKPAMQEAWDGRTSELFTRFEAEVEKYLSTSSGSAALDIQPWQQSLLDEVDEVEQSLTGFEEEPTDSTFDLPQVLITREQFEEQLTRWDQSSKQKPD